LAHFRACLVATLFPSQPNININKPAATIAPACILVQVPRGGIAYTSFYQFFFHDCSKSHPCQAKKSLLSVCFSGKSSLLSILPRPTDQRDQPLHEGFEEPEVQIDLPQFRKVNSGCAATSCKLSNM
jgi:hypothetical protein